jgi:hypothetical protein
VSSAAGYQRTLLLEVTRDELGQIVLGLSMLPYAEELHRRLSHRHFNVCLHPVLADTTRRVWWRSFEAGQERAVEWYDPATCDRIDAAVERAWRNPRKHRRPPRA